MGMFDYVNLKCPHCGATYATQSKGGDCTLATYDLHDAPSDVVLDVNRHAPFTCEECGAMFEVGIRVWAFERKL